MSVILINIFSVTEMYRMTDQRNPMLLDYPSGSQDPLRDMIDLDAFGHIFERPIGGREYQGASTGTPDLFSPTPGKVVISNIL